jgi:hypothetical protein
MNCKGVIPRENESGDREDSADWINLVRHEQGFFKHGTALSGSRSRSVHSVALRDLKAKGASGETLDPLRQ